jgi:primosomal protein N' (replication factor Y)
VTDPGLIVIDEEHDGSYKQDQTPRYHARQVAAWRAARQERPCALVLGSATPSLETFHLAGQGRYRMARMQERASGASMPSVEFIDMKRFTRKRGTLSPPLVQRLREVVAAGQQAVLLLNRRGFSQYLQCQDCGHVEGCDHCSIALTYHRRPPRLACHYCFHQRAVPDTCSKCRGLQLEFKGAGTERLEEELEAAIPGVTVARMDRDTTSKAGAHAEILRRFGEGEAQILLGTQMVSKGLDFPRVTLVGVLNADQGLNVPDFRAGERTFQLLTQVAGRAVRSELPWSVLMYALDI